MHEVSQPLFIGDLNMKLEQAVKEIRAAFEEIKGKHLQNLCREMVEPPTRSQMFRSPPRIGRNEKCPCGSGKKFKKCCMVKGLL